MVNGIPKFKSSEHLDQYIAYLDELCGRDTTGRTDEDSLLLSVENSLGYTSLRKKILDEQQAFDEVGWSRMEEIPDWHWIPGASLQSVYNSNGDFQIGDSIYHLFSPDFDIIICNGDYETLNKAHRLTRRDSLTFWGEFNSDTTDYIRPRKYMPAKVIDIECWKIASDTDWQVNFDKLWLSGWCNNNTLYKPIGVTLTANGIPNSQIYPSPKRCHYLIEWGDNTPNTTHAYDVGPLNGYTNLLNMPEHSYPSAGTYHLKISARLDYHITWVASKTLVLEIPPAPCFWPGEKSTGWWWAYSPNGGRAVRGRLCTVSPTIWGNPYFRAESEGYKRINGTYKHRKVHRLVVQMWGQTYESEPDCNVPGTYVQEAAWPFDDKNVTQRSPGFLLWQGQFTSLYSNHRAYEDESSTSFANLDLELKSCP